MTIHDIKQLLFIAQQIKSAIIISKKYNLNAPPHSFKHSKKEYIANQIRGVSKFPTRKSFILWLAPS